eukprot:6330686-Amphidinium_carterae.1
MIHQNWFEQSRQNQGLHNGTIVTIRNAPREYVTYFATCIMVCVLPLTLTNGVECYTKSIETRTSQTLENARLCLPLFEVLGELQMCRNRTMLARKGRRQSKKLQMRKPRMPN